ncbi:IPT/TIG domain-containing protein [Paenibacillus sp. sptzw28]|uniref:IPT/TIG domain-containing protein n=1 Tax=Paenibacillus sp. sptzw28 TaxID=715179 RepID=UPI001C6E60EB|nr:IPT/TIG domain-containing protein [Paenibacillus sp. sptzw28]QYR20277.1 IPT/TIG domain-containing protein [Paenibacillus sp. sptzw28]
MSVSITSFTPTSGKEHTLVTLYGSGFERGSKVKFNGLAVTTANVTFYSSTKMTAKVPPQASTGKITVQTPGGNIATSRTSFRVQSSLLAADMTELALLSYPPFNEAHPPLMTDPDTFPPERTADFAVGEFMIQSGNFDRVYDPLYPWQDLQSYHNTDDYAKMQAYKSERDSKVDHYLVTRKRFWKLTDRHFYGEDTEITVTVHRGIINHHSSTEEKTFTSRIQIDLGLHIGGDLGVPDVPPVELAAGLAAASEQPTDDLGFTFEMSQTLHFTQVDEQTYTEETTTTTDVHYKGQTHYLNWQIYEQLVIKRIPKAGQESFFKDESPIVSSMTAITPIQYTDRFTVQAEKDPKDESEYQLKIIK